MKLNPLVMMRKEFDGTGIVFDPEQNKAMTLNHVGTLIWGAIEKEIPEEKIVEMITSKFSVESDVAAKDLSDFLLVLKNRGLLSD